MFLNYNFLYDVLGNNWSLCIHRNNFWNIKWYLNLNTLNFSVIDINFLIFNTISISWDRNLSNYLIWNSPLYLNLYYSISFNNFLNYPIHFYNLILFYVNYHLFLNFNPLYLFNLFYYDLWDLNFNYLKYWNLYKYYLLNYFWALDYFLYNSWNYHYFFYDSLYLDNPGNLYYLLDYFFNYMCLYSNNFLFYNNRNRLLNINLLNDFLFDRYNFAFLDLQFSYLFSTNWNMNFSDNGNLFCNVTRNNFLYL